jgi:hypothetical protein
VPYPNSGSRIANSASDVRCGARLRGWLTRGAAHSKQRPFGLEAVTGEPGAERLSGVDGVDPNRATARSGTRGRHEGLRDAVIVSDDRPNLIEQPAFPPEAVVQPSPLSTCAYCGAPRSTHSRTARRLPPKTAGSCPSRSGTSSAFTRPRAHAIAARIGGARTASRHRARQPPLILEPVLFVQRRPAGVASSRIGTGGSPRLLWEEPHADDVILLDTPQGRAVMYATLAETATGAFHALIVRTPDGQRRQIAPLDASWPELVYSPSGHILYRKGPTERPSIWALPFSPRTLDLEGEPFLVERTGLGMSVATEGTFVYLDFGPDLGQFFACAIAAGAFSLGQRRDTTRFKTSHSHRTGIELSHPSSMADASHFGSMTWRDL